MVVALGGVRECSTSATVMNTHALQERNTNLQQQQQHRNITFKNLNEAIERTLNKNQVCLHPFCLHFV